MRPLVVLVALFAGTVALADGKIDTRDLAGSNGDWQEGHAVIDAPLGEVRRWLLDFENWPARFPDVESATVLARPASDAARLRFRSRIIGRELTVELRWRGDEIVYRGSGDNVSVQGKILVRRLDDRRTDVVMQSSADVHGLASVFATKELKRERAFKKLRADLDALERLAGARRTTL